MDVAARHRGKLLALGVVLYAAVGMLVLTVERPGLGLGHFFYLPIVVVAFAAGPWAGLAGGVLAALMYAVGIVVNPHLPPELESAQTAIRLATYCAVGMFVGVFARANRSLLAELLKLATRDTLTSLPNTRAFETAIDRRLRSEQPFVLLVGDVDELRRSDREIGDQALMRLADRLAAGSRPGDDVARIGGDEFAVLSGVPAGGARSLALLFETQLSSENESITFGWATYPSDGENALSLYRAADERLYARKVTRGYRRDLSQLV